MGESTAEKEVTSWREFRQELKAEWDEVLESAWSVVLHPKQEPARFCLFLLWASGAVLDALSTQLMMFFGYEEQNPVVAAAMGTVGSEIYIMLVTAVFLCFAVLAVAYPKSTFGWTVFVTMTVACLIKFWVAIANISFWFHTG